MGMQERNAARMVHIKSTTKANQQVEGRSGSAQGGKKQLSHKMQPQNTTKQQFILYFIPFSFRMHARHSRRGICKCFTLKACVRVCVWICVGVCVC